MEREWITTYNTLLEAVNQLSSSTVLSIDSETSHHPWYHPKFSLLCVSISDGSLAFTVPIHHPQAPTSEGTELLASLFESLDPDVWVMQNGVFDVLALRAVGVEAPMEWFDTLAAQYLLDVEAPKGLEALAQNWLGLPPWKDIDYKKPEDEELDVLARLCERDAAITAQLYEPMSQALTTEPELEHLYYTLLFPAMLALMEMEYEGVPIDRAKLQDLTIEVEDELEEILEELRRYADDEDFNPNSTLQLQKVLFGKLGLPVVDFTPKGAPSTNAEVLRKLSHLHGIIPKLQRYRELRKLLTASLIPWEEFSRWDGKLHPRYKPAFVKTGRLSSEMPNIQQVPRDARVRALFGGVEGHKVVELDYSQLELRIVAWLSGEARMLDAYKAGEDLHQVTADLLGVDRHTGKTANFGLLYGAGYRKLRAIAESDYGVHMTELEAEAIRNQWFDTYSSVEEFHEECIAEARAHGGVTTILGRWRPLPDIHSNDWPKKGGAERQAVNTPVQSVASDLTLSVLTDLVNADWLRRRGIRPIITVHDSIIFLVPEDQMDMIDTIKGVMENPAWKRKFGVTIPVPLVVDEKHGDYWGES